MTLRILERKGFNQWKVNKGNEIDEGVESFITGILFKSLFKGMPFQQFELLWTVVCVLFLAHYITQLACL